ncbi:Ribosomal protein S10, mitochondrial [Tetrabaena socialis]|uniref:Ribosomal protein S10, mitochondrial n=1 Tax=Tetrabaena socialis TaxID=47790 RepID=A0A2J8A6S9_9CHLO|nr:Ribosomal protein S10, mitochondrial [Tetrabaena socialis]|eukprot:PNH08228.1 Ribosomal protein S10, mitochondrial [Tetrabaena socialis]
MQQSALRALWASPLQQARGALPSALQQLLAGADAALPSPGPTRDSEPACATTPSTSGRSSHADQLTAWGRRHLGGTAAGGTWPAAPSPSAATPAPAQPTGAYEIEIAVTAFEKRYVDMACNALGDIMLLALSPKSYAALPTGSAPPDNLPVNLAWGAARRDIRLPWRRTRFTLIRGPHIDKQGMEQFERREYKSLLAASTNSGEEVRRLLEALKLYQFTGVQIRTDVTSAQRLELPPHVLELLRPGAQQPARTAAGQAAEAEKAAGGVSLLGSSFATLPAPRSSEEALEAELGAVLRVLRPLVHAGLEQRQRVLSAVSEYRAWHAQQQQQQRGAPPAVVPAEAGAGAAAAPPLAGDAAALAAAGGEAYGAFLRQRLRQQLELQRSSAAAVLPGAEAGQVAGKAAAPPAAAAAAAAYGLDPTRAAELLARIDSELLHAHEAAAAAVAAAPPAGGAADAAASSAAAARRAADASLQVQAPGLALRLLQLWWAATSIEFKQHLQLPPEAVEKRIVEEVRRRQEEAKAAPKAGEAAEGKGAN